MGINDNTKKLKLFSAIFLLVGGMVGSAIFSLSGLSITYAGPASILSWIIAAIIELCYGFAIAELATRYRKNGGNFVFPERTFVGRKGRLLGFLSVWGTMMADIVSTAFAAMYIGIYLSVSFPMMGKYSNILAIATILFCLILNSINITTTGKVNNVLAIGLILLLAFYSIMALTCGNFSFERFVPFFNQGDGTFGFLKAVPIAMIGYSAITSIGFMSDEIDNPRKNIVKAMVISIIIVVLLYTLTIFVTVGNITAKELVDTKMDFIPLFAVCFNNISNKPWLANLLSIAAVFALITTILVVMAMNGRNVKAVADRGLLPSIFSKVNKANMPIYVMIVFAVASIILSQFHSIIEILINLGALFIVVTIVINFISLLVTRKKNQGYENHFNVPLSSTVLILILIIILLCYIPDIINGGYVLFVFSILWYMIGFFIYLIHSRRLYKLEVVGIVIHGKGKGKTVGMPTANIEYDKDEMEVDNGVYASKILVEGKEYVGVTNVGTRPSVDDEEKITVETHIIDFDKDIYGQEIVLKIVDRIRDIEKFNSLSEVKKQVDKDIEYARKIVK